MISAGSGASQLSKEAFDHDWYLKTNPDVKAAGLDPWDHYVSYGYAEGRAGAPLRALELDHILWRGFATEALVELRLLLRGKETVERAAAGWVLARYAASKGRWHSARAAIKAFTDAPAAARSVPHPGPWLLAVQTAARLGDIAAARQVLTQAQHYFGDERGLTAQLRNAVGRGLALSWQARELALAALEIEIASGADDRILNRHLAPLHAGTGLSRLTLLPALPAPQDASAPFDRITARKPPAPILDGPLVTVVIPSFNAQDTITTCLRGLTAQSWQNLEIIVVDDGSTDRTAQIVAAAAQTDRRITLLRLTTNCGTYVARNTGFARAKGAFFTVHDADDWSHPQKIAAQVAPLLEKPAVMATASHWVRADNDLRMTRWRMEDGWIHRNVSSLMIRTALRDTLGFWDRIRTNADTEYYLRLLSVFGADAIEEVHQGVPLSFGRTHALSLTMQAQSSVATQFIGPRRSYMDAAKHWHRTQIAQLPEGADHAARAAALHMPQDPGQRLFFAPVAIGPYDRYEQPDDYGQIAGSSLFDGTWYLRRNPDVLAADIDPVGHYLAQGADEDRDAGPAFPTAAWRRFSGKDAPFNPLLWVQGQQWHPSVQPYIPGALERADDPRVLVFGHAADAEVFGAERSLLITLDRLAQGFSGRGFSGQRFAPVVVLPSAVNEDYLREVMQRAVAVEILPLVWRHRFRTAPAATITTIRHLIRRYRPDAVHVNTLVLDAPLIAARLEDCPTVVHVRELPAQDAELCRILGDTERGLRRRLLAQSDRFIANSQAVAQWINCPERTTIWPNAVDPNLFDTPFLPGARIRIALISSNMAKKGIVDFIRVAQHVATLETAAAVPQTRRCCFYLIGPVTDALSALFPLPDNVTHQGYAPDPMAALQQCDIVMVLSHFAESFGRTTLEAQAAGRPVICYDRGTPPTLIEDRVTGFVVPPDDPDAAAKAVFTLAHARQDLEKMSKQARAKAALFIQVIPGLTEQKRTAQEGGTNNPR